MGMKFWRLLFLKICLWGLLTSPLPRRFIFSLTVWAYCRPTHYGRVA